MLLAHKCLYLGREEVETQILVGFLTSLPLSSLCTLICLALLCASVVFCLLISNRSLYSNKLSLLGRGLLWPKQPTAGQAAMLYVVFCSWALLESSSAHSSCSAASPSPVLWVPWPWCLCGTNSMLLGPAMALGGNNS